MVESLLIFLLWLCVIALIVTVVCWVVVKVVTTVWEQAPAKIATLIYLIGGLIVLIWAVSHLPGVKLP